MSFISIPSPYNTTTLGLAICSTTSLLELNTPWGHHFGDLLSSTFGWWLLLAQVASSHLPPLRPLMKKGLLHSLHGSLHQHCPLPMEGRRQLVSSYRCSVLNWRSLNTPHFWGNSHITPMIMECALPLRPLQQHHFSIITTTTTTPSFSPDAPCENQGCSPFPANSSGQWWVRLCFSFLF